MTKNKEYAILSIPQKPDVKLEIIKSNYGPDVIDVTKLYSETGMFSYDPGFMSTAACTSNITYIDGEKGELLHRGYNISDLANKCDFLEVVHLLLYGDLPNKEEFTSFANKITKHTMVHEQIYQVLDSFIRSSHPMSMIIGLFGSLSAFYHEQDHFTDPANIDLFCTRAIAKILTIVTMVYKHYIGQPIIHPCNKLDYSSNFLKMMFSIPVEDYEINPIFRDAINAIFILHADHEQNASTATVRLAGSTGANPFACIAAGVASLWGPAHGGANEAVIAMLENIGNVDRIPEFIAKAKDKNSGFKLMGFGHRVYKNFDPRANVLKEKAKNILGACENKYDLKLLEIAHKLEEIALNDEYFISRKLYPNVDFYSGLILKTIGIPKIMFTPIFALARVSGWVAQWKEMVDQKSKIGRPRQLYMGHQPREFINMNKR